jgi:hypothetical protein
MRGHRSGTLVSGPPRSGRRLEFITLLSLAAGAASGCFSDRGVAIEVDVSATCVTHETCATSVELYLGAQACDPKTNTAGITCASIAPPDGTFALPGKVWFRDALTPETAEVKNGKATFQLRADTPTTLPIVIAVGKVGSGMVQMGVGTATLHDLTIPTSNARVITTALTPATPAAPSSPRSPGDHVLFWSKSTPPSSCVMVEHGNETPVTRDFVVPAEDPDCDDVPGVPTPECNPAAFDGTNMVGGARDRPDCFSSSGGPACTLGSFGCMDGVPTTNSTCSPPQSQAQRTCIPQGFCATGCNMFDDACMRNQLAAATPPARVECKVPTVLSLGNLGLCINGNQATIDLGAEFSAGSCPNPQIGALPGTVFDDHHPFGGATMKLSSAARPCQFTVTWTDGTRPKLAMDDVGMLRFEPEAGATLLLPIVFHFLSPADTCFTTDFQCTYVGAPQDSIWGCAR